VRALLKSRILSWLGPGRGSQIQRSPQARESSKEGAVFVTCVVFNIPCVANFPSAAKQWADLGTGYSDEPTGWSSRRFIPHDGAIEVFGVGHSTPSSVQETPGRTFYQEFKKALWDDEEYQSNMFLNGFLSICEKLIYKLQQTAFTYEFNTDKSTGKVSDPESLLFYVGFDTPD
jgi:hypothetical protein